MTGLERFNDLSGLLMLDRSKVRFQTKRETPVGFSSAQVVEVHFRDACLCKQTRDGVTPEDDPTSLKKAKLESAHWEGPDTWSTLPGPRVPFK